MYATQKYPSQFPIRFQSLAHEPGCLLLLCCLSIGIEGVAVHTDANAVGHLYEQDILGLVNPAHHTMYATCRDHLVAYGKGIAELLDFLLFLMLLLIF